MANTITIDLHVAIVLLIVVLLVYAFEAILFWWKLNKIRPARQPEGDPRLDLLEDELASLKLAVSALQFADSLPAHEQENETPVIEKTAPETAYSLAIELAKKGADAATLVKECGLSRAEADLIVAIYHGVYKG